MDLITTDTAAQIEQQYAASKRAKRLGKTVKPQSDDAADADGKKKAGKKAAAAGKKSTKGATVLETAANDAWDSYVRGSMPEAVQDYVPEDPFSPEEEEEMQKEMEKIGSDAQRINDYYEAFPETRPPSKPHYWTGMDHPEEIAAELGRVRGVVNGKGGEDTVKMGVLGVAKGAEWLMHTYGYNPMGLNVKGMAGTLAKVMMQPGNDFEPEIKQIRIEYSDWLASRPEARLAFKLFVFAQTYSELQNNPELAAKLAAAQSAPAPAAAPTAAAPESIPKKKASVGPRRTSSLFAQL